MRGEGGSDFQTLVERIGTLHEERLVIFDNDTSLQPPMAQYTIPP